MMSDKENRAAAARAVPFVDGRMLIGGKMVESVSGEWLESHDPANLRPIGRVPMANAKDAEIAYAAAAKAQKEWAALDMSRRAEILLKFCDRIEERAAEILAVEIADTGNTIVPMRNDITKGLDRLKYFIGLAYELKGDTVASTAQNLHFTLREPYGVCARILAFNHPINFALCSIGAPLMAGNSIILKPSEQSPLSASLFGEVAAETLPPGLVNVLTGGKAAGEALARHPKIRRLSFVGSPQIGMAIQRAAAESCVKHITLELGGKNAFIVYPDAPVAEVARAAIAGMNFGWQGQSCSSTSRLMVHESIYDEVVEAVREAVAGVRVGDPFDENTKMGPVNSASQYEKVRAAIRSGIEEGARLIFGGNRPEGAFFETGYWIEPTVFADVTPSMRLAREEIFGPVLSIMKWSDEEEALEIANSVDLGLTGAIWTRDISRALNAARRLECGYVWVNGAGVHVRGLPYGGYKNSGIGRERTLEELVSYTQEKAVSIML